MDERFDPNHHQDVDRWTVKEWSLCDCEYTRLTFGVSRTVSLPFIVVLKIKNKSANKIYLFIDRFHFAILLGH